MLIADDDDVVRDVVRRYLERDGLDVSTAHDGNEALRLLCSQRIDVAILDVMMPGPDGLSLCGRLREGGAYSVPVILLTALGEEDDRIAGLEAGADDYLTKPFDKKELFARIQAVVRRSAGHSQSIIMTGLLTVNLDAHTVEVEGQPIHLTGKEYGILELLSLRKGTTLTKEMFLNHLYGGMDEPELKIIDVFICKLRKKLSHACGGENYIETVWGRGYVLRDPNEEAEAA